MKQERVLIVDDDPKLQRLLRAQLVAREYSVRVVERGEEAILVTAEFDPDLILMNLCLPGISGLETCRRLREWTRTPIIVLDGSRQEQLAVQALDTGADDYVTRPFNLAELLARMRAVLRRVREWTVVSAEAAPLTFRNLTLDLVNRRVLLNGQGVHLTPTEYELLRVLATHAGRILTHRELLTRIWGAASANDTQYLHVFIPQLRRKLEPHPDSPHHILTEPGVGYYFSNER